MARSIIIIIFVITISQSGLAVKCSDKSIEYKVAGEQFYDTYKEMINLTITKKITENKTVTALTENSKNFLSASKLFCKSSTNNTNETWSHEKFIQLLDFSLKNATLITDLVQNNRFKCIDSLKTEINGCYKKSNASLWGKLHARSYLTFNRVTCPQTNRNGKCVIKILEEKCEPVLTNYVKSLFEFMSDNYCKGLNEPNTSQTSTDDSNNGAGRLTCLATVSMFLLEFVLMIPTYS